MEVPSGYYNNAIVPNFQQLAPFGQHQYVDGCLPFPQNVSFQMPQPQSFYYHPQVSRQYLVGTKEPFPQYSAFSAPLYPQVPEFSQELAQSSYPTPSASYDYYPEARLSDPCDSHADTSLIDAYSPVGMVQPDTASLLSLPGMSFKAEELHAPFVEHAPQGFYYSGHEAMAAPVPFQGIGVQENTPLPSPMDDRKFSMEVRHALDTSKSSLISKGVVKPRKSPAKKFRKPVVIEDSEHTTQPGPIPASVKPDLIIDEANGGEEKLLFFYSTQKIIKKFTIKCGKHRNIASLEEYVDALIASGELSEKYMVDNCVYPRALCDAASYTGNRYNYEKQCNKIGWFLCFLNGEAIIGQRGLIQRAVDSWRNTRVETKFKSRRVRNQIKVTTVDAV
ncbi:hypothetical protein BABINDRAFT_160600 [Babjeviella inositovora NRRL Y-12698]|uniref:DUF8032 domain-containing protein n=1 Tax=Babjeviella inositovora NRRL Y-12698 TaxID=984486 RepID=A0A1E3QVV3_9ASCO|nr:uncharacterized protein BABINDRAFT_160600 [Babjeviella inositovora NRRL Y-12698]ODQ81212.1 hypothetical protein BABINDRAFT_160600 [Babjeviella inositovora NRRL Y-12698]